jgi:hypothetical protein
MAPSPTSGKPAGTARSTAATKPSRSKPSQRRAASRRQIQKGWPRRRQRLCCFASERLRSRPRPDLKKGAGSRPLFSCCGCAQLIHRTAETDQDRIVNLRQIRLARAPIRCRLCFLTDRRPASCTGRGVIVNGGDQRRAVARSMSGARLVDGAQNVYLAEYDLIRLLDKPNYCDLIAGARPN